MREKSPLLSGGTQKWTQKWGQVLLLKLLFHVDLIQSDIDQSINRNNQYFTDFMVSPGQEYHKKPG
jgi:hypothetical protein